MNELAIKKHDFELAKSRLKEFSEKKEVELSIERVQTDGWFFGLGDHKVTGTELNSRLETIQNHLIDINSTNNKTIKEFREIYNALDALDKDYMTSIVASIKAIEKTSNDVRNQQGVLNEHNRELKEHQNKLDSHQGEIDKIVGNIKQTVSVLKTFKEKLDGFEHLTEIDTIWSDCKNICNEIQIVSDSITKLSKKTTSEIWAATSQNKVIAEQINQIRDIKHLNEVDLMWDDINDARESFNSIEKCLHNIDNDIFKMQSQLSEMDEYVAVLKAYVHLKDIDNMWAGLENAQKDTQKLSKNIDELEKNQSIMDGFTKNNRQAITELEVFRNTIDDIGHLKDVDSMWGDINGAKQLLEVIENELQNLDDDIIEVQGGLNELDEYVGGLKEYVHLQDIDDMWVDLSDAKTDTQKLFGDIGNINDVIEKNQNDLDILNNKSIEHKEAIDELVKNQSTMATFTKNNRQAITELEMFRKTVDAIEHLKEVDPMWSDINEAKETFNRIKKDLQNLGDGINKAQGGLNELDEYVGGLKKYVHLQDIDDMWAGLLEAKTDTQKLFGDIGNINNIIEKNQNNLDILNNKSIEHKEAIDGLIKNQSTMATFTKNNRQAITELEMFRKTVDAIEHLKEVDLMWEQGNSLQDGLSIANNDIGILQQKALEAEKSFTEYKNQTEDVLAEFKKKIKYAYLIAGGSLGIAILEIILIMAGVI